MTGGPVTIYNKEDFIAQSEQYAMRLKPTGNDIFLSLRQTFLAVSAGSRSDDPETHRLGYNFSPIHSAGFRTLRLPALPPFESLPSNP